MIVNRRVFLKQTTAGTCACAIGSIALNSCASYVFAPYQLIDNRVVVEKSAFIESDYVLVKVEQIPEAIFVSKSPEDKYAAVLTRCPHKGCEVRPAAGTLRCPCHSSEFDLKGKVLEGPAENDLSQFKVTTDDLKIYIS